MVGSWEKGEGLKQGSPVYDFGAGNPQPGERHLLVNQRFSQSFHAYLTVGHSFLRLANEVKP